MRRRKQNSKKLPRPTRSFLMQSNAVATIGLAMLECRAAPEQAGERRVLAGSRTSSATFLALVMCLAERDRVRAVRRLNVALTFATISRSSLRKRRLE